MATGFLIPNGTGFYREGTANQDGLLVDPSLVHTVIDDPVGTPDEDTSEARIANDGARFSFLLPRPSEAGITDIGTITSIKLVDRARRGAPGGGAQLQTFFRQNGINVDTPAPTHVLVTSYTDNTREFTANPILSGPWLLNDFENRAIEIGFLRVVGVGGSTFHCTQFYAIIDYEPFKWARAASASGTWSASAAASGVWGKVSTPGGSWSRE
jgi:hypothetical protein